MARSKKPHCVCYAPDLMEGVAFRVGDKVIQEVDYGQVNYNVVQTVIRVAPLPLGSTSNDPSTKASVSNWLSGKAFISCTGALTRSFVSTDGGAICKKCGFREGSPRSRLNEGHFRKATEEEIRVAEQRSC